MPSSTDAADCTVQNSTVLYSAEVHCNAQNSHLLRGSDGKGGCSQHDRHSQGGQAGPRSWQHAGGCLDAAQYRDHTRITGTGRGRGGRREGTNNAWDAVAADGGRGGSASSSSSGGGSIGSSKGCSSPGSQLRARLLEPTTAACGACASTRHVHHVVFCEGG
jgi:hypothetical protein